MPEEATACARCGQSWSGDGPVHYCELIAQANAAIEEEFQVSMGGVICFLEVHKWAQDNLRPTMRLRADDPLSTSMYGGASYQPPVRWTQPTHTHRHLMTVLASVTGRNTVRSYNFIKLLEVAVIVIIKQDFEEMAVDQMAISTGLIRTAETQYTYLAEELMSLPR